MPNARWKRRETHADLKYLRATINLFTPVNLIQHMDVRGLSVQGNLNVLRDRLYRFSVNIEEPSVNRCNWNPEVDERPDDALPMTTAGVNAKMSQNYEAVRLKDLAESSIQSEMQQKAIERDSSSSFTTRSSKNANEHIACLEKELRALKLQLAQTGIHEQVRRSPSPSSISLSSSQSSSSHRRCYSAGRRSIRRKSSKRPSSSRHRESSSDACQNYHRSLRSSMASYYSSELSSSPQRCFSRKSRLTKRSPSRGPSHRDNQRSRRHERAPKSYSECCSSSQDKEYSRSQKYKNLRNRSKERLHDYRPPYDGKFSVHNRENSRSPKNSGKTLDAVKVRNNTSLNFEGVSFTGKNLVSYECKKFKVVTQINTSENCIVRSKCLKTVHKRTSLVRDNK